MYKKIFIALMMTLCSPTTQIFTADSGTLDVTFNPTGIRPGTVSTNIDNTLLDNFGQSVVVQNDGKIVVAGFTSIGGIFRFAVARFNTDGSLDTTFNTAGPQPGTVSTTINNNVVENSFGQSVALQSDGKIVVAGYANVSGVRQFAVARFNTNGTLDATFNTTGAQPGTLTTTIDGDNFDAVGQSVTIQNDDKIVVAGFAFTSATVFGYKFAVARLNTDGTLDTTTFNTAGPQAGTVSTTIDNQTSSFGRSVALQSNGKIVVAGDGGVNGFAVARFNTDGTLDTTTFNTGGVQPGTVSTTVDNGTSNLARSVAIQSDDKIVVAGSSTVDGSNKFAVARFNTNGTLDTTTFNAGGVQPGTVSTGIDGISTNADGYSVALQSDGKIVVAGEATILITKFAVAQFNTNGRLDATFNTAGPQPGTTSTRIDNSITNFGQAVALQIDGKIVIAGYMSTNSIFKFGVARFNGDQPVPPAPIVTPCVLKLILKYRPRLVVES